MKKLIIPVLCSVLLSLPTLGQNKPRAVAPTAEYYIDRYLFDDAEALIEKNIKQLKRRRKSTVAEEQKLSRIDRLRSMMNATERITLIDSTVVDKNSFLSHIKLSPESGELNTYSSFFNRPGIKDCSVYLSELGNKIYFSQPDARGQNKLYTSDLIGNEWSAPLEIKELSTDSVQNYPFMLSDGITLYYAAQGEESIGGYDIFVTRYDIDERKFLHPENIGMPFNSTANDYMLAIDEFNNLGWLVSDRNQPEGKVCIYMFIPNEIREIYNTEETPVEQLAKLALIHSISDTWKDKNTIQAAKSRLQTVLKDRIETKKQKDFDFVITDRLTYTLIRDFKSTEAKKRISIWKKIKTN